MDKKGYANVYYKNKFFVYYHWQFKIYFKFSWTRCCVSLSILVDDIDHYWKRNWPRCTPQRLVICTHILYIMCNLIYDRKLVKNFLHAHRHVSRRRAGNVDRRDFQGSIILQKYSRSRFIRCTVDFCIWIECSRIYKFD